MLAEFAIHDPDTEWREGERESNKKGKKKGRTGVLNSFHLTLHEHREGRNVILDIHSYTDTNGKAEAIESIAKQDPIKYKSSHLACNLSE